MTNLEELIQMASELSDEDVDLLLQQVRNMTSSAKLKEEPQSAQQKRIRNKAGNPPCIYCHSSNVVKDGKSHKKQRYWCKNCNKTFVPTSKTVMQKSHYDRSIWEDVIEDTFNGMSIDFTADNLGLHHETVFIMRHKILMAIQKLGDQDPIILGNITELDETYVLESNKGTKFNADSQRKPRKRGSKASKRGLSNEQICICTGVERKGVAYATTVNRAKPSNLEIQEAFGDHIDEGTVCFADGLKGYKSLEESNDCIVECVSVEEMKQTKTANLNNVNSFHSFIKSRYEDYRGVASKYINRYNQLFAKGFRNRKETIQRVSDILFNDQNNDRSATESDIKEWRLTPV